MSSCDESAASDDRVNLFEKKKKIKEGGGVLGFMYRYFNFLNPNHKKNKREVCLRARSLLGLLAQLVEHWIPNNNFFPDDASFVK